MSVYWTSVGARESHTNVLTVNEHWFDPISLHIRSFVRSPMTWVAMVAITLSLSLCQSPKSLRRQRHARQQCRHIFCFNAQVKWITLSPSHLKLLFRTFSRRTDWRRTKGTKSIWRSIENWTKDATLKIINIIIRRFGHKSMTYGFRPKMMICLRFSLENIEQTHSLTTQLYSIANIRVNERLQQNRSNGNAKLNHDSPFLFNASNGLLWCNGFFPCARRTMRKSLLYMSSAHLMTSQRAFHFDFLFWCKMKMRLWRWVANGCKKLKMIWLQSPANCLLFFGWISFLAFASFCFLSRFGAKREKSKFTLLSTKENAIHFVILQSTPSTNDGFSLFFLSHAFVLSFALIRWPFVRIFINKTCAKCVFSVVDVVNEIRKFSIAVYIVTVKNQ